MSVIADGWWRYETSGAAERARSTSSREPAVVNLLQLNSPLRALGRFLSRNGLILSCFLIGAVLLVLALAR